MTWTAADIEQRLDALYGVVDWRAAKGVLHVAAIAVPSRAMIVPGIAAPQSETDRFALGAARSRADAIVTTGAILRSEPDVRHDASHVEGENRGFLEWRRGRLGLLDEPLLVVLTASGELPVDHPALDSASGGFVWTTSQGAARLRRSSVPRFRENAGRERARVSSELGNLEIIEGDPERPPILGAIRALFQRPGIDTILIEAGASATRPLYPESDGFVDGVRCHELLLSRYEGNLMAAAKGPDFFSERVVEHCYAGTGGEPPQRSEVRIEDTSGSWTICRYRAN